MQIAPVVSVPIARASLQQEAKTYQLTQDHWRTPKMAVVAAVAPGMSMGLHTQSPYSLIGSYADGDFVMEGVRLVWALPAEYVTGTDMTFMLRGYVDGPRLPAVQDGAYVGITAAFKRGNANDFSLECIPAAPLPGNEICQSVTIRGTGDAGKLWVSWTIPGDALDTPFANGDAIDLTIFAYCEDTGGSGSNQCRVAIDLAKFMLQVRG